MFFAEQWWKVPVLGRRTTVSVSGGACVLFALMLLVLPLQWLLAAVLAALFHESCHALAVLLFGGRIRSLHITAGGAKMVAAQVAAGGEWICALAGPVGGLSLLLFARWIPRVALCAAMQSLWNLLPIDPLDGGRVLRCWTERMLPANRADGLCKSVAAFCSALLVGLGIYGSLFLHLGLLPLLPGVFSLLGTKSGKTPCKQGPKQVQ